MVSLGQPPLLKWQESTHPPSAAKKPVSHWQRVERSGAWEHVECGPQPPSASHGSTQAPPIFLETGLAIAIDEAVGVMGARPVHRAAAVIDGAFVHARVALQRAAGRAGALHRVVPRPVPQREPVPQPPLPTVHASTQALPVSAVPMGHVHFTALSAPCVQVAPVPQSPFRTVHALTHSSIEARRSRLAGRRGGRRRWLRLAGGQRERDEHR